MAASSPLSNFLSFLLPAKPPPPPKLAAMTAVIPSPNSTAANGRQSLVATAAQPQPQETRFSATATAAAVMCPSMEYANTLYFRSAYNVQVVVDDNESEERLLNRFRREVMRAGVIQECKRRRYHENKQDEAKRRTRDAAKRNRRRRPPPRFAVQNKSEVPSSKREDDGDNWDLPEGNLPY